LRVGVFQSVGARLLPELVLRLREQAPAFTLEVVEESSDGQLLELVARGDLDLAFAMVPLPEGPFATAEILREPFVLLAAASSPLAGRRWVSLSQLGQESVVAGRSCRATAAAEQALRAEVGTLEVAFRSDDNETICALVAAGLGVALVPRLLVDDRDQRLVALEVDGAVPPRRIALAWHAERGRSAAIERVVELSHEIARDLGLAGAEAVVA
jgi:DNA-binding transcriptional LysR family regulator